MKYPREYLAFAERVLREYPQNVDELKRLEETIIACCHMPLIPDVPGGGGTDTEPERVTIAKEQNKHYQWLTNRISKIQKGMATLAKEEREIVKALYWDDLRIREVAEVFHFSERGIKNIRVRALHKLSRVFIPFWVK
jgi:DNA-directed RNA polymerase specialized sigma subunit